MKCCVNCFNDNELKSIIYQFGEIGDCDFCNSHNVSVYDIDKDDIIGNYMLDILEIYTIKDYLPHTFPKEKLSSLYNILKNKWHIFNSDKTDIHALIKELCKNKYAKIDDIFAQPVGIKEEMLLEYLDKHSIMRNHTWTDFVEAIKYKNRFHLDYINLEELGKLLTYTEIQVSKNNHFYRARICKNKEALDITEMGAPPANLSVAGRANSEGISCLYLANEIETTFYEIRAILYDFVCVATFKPIKDLKIIDLSNISGISPFLDSLDYTEYAINIETLNKIGQDLAKPVRRHDSKLDYLPTQYISDFIKSLGYDGIKYKSTLSEKGYNLTIFNPSLFEYAKKEVEVFEIKSIDYRYEKIN